MVKKSNSSISYSKKYAECLRYIDEYWPRITRTQTTDDPRTGAISLPEPFLTPNTDRFGIQFYWDSYFMFQGILGTDHHHLAKSMLTNFAYLYEKFHMIPLASSVYLANISQPPFLSSMIMDTYQARPEGNNGWLSHYMDLAKREYFEVWLEKNFDKTNELLGTYHHHVEDQTLSSYGDRDAGYHLNAERESGWDMTSRFYNRCGDFLPIDLNCFLYKYESDFAETARIIGDTKEEKLWLDLQKKRRKEIQLLLWNETEGFFFDFDYRSKRQSTFKSLASFVALWSGVATPKQAQKMINHLPLFETEYGLTCTTQESLPLFKVEVVKNLPDAYHMGVLDIAQPKQWDYPYIWPPLEYLTVMGLLKYNYKKEAIRIMQKSLEAQNHIFKKHKALYEKFDGTMGDIGKSFHYPSQKGFGWTNAVFSRYIQLLETI